MRNKKLKITLALTCILTAFVVPVAARWTLPIRPGDHVFDIKRFMDSVKETTDMINVAQQYIQMAKNMTLKNAVENIDNLIKHYNYIENRTLNIIKEAKSIINPKSAATRKADQAPTTITLAASNIQQYSFDIMNEKAITLQETLHVDASTLKDSNEIVKSINDSLKNISTGNLAEMQKRNDIRSKIILDNINDFWAQGSHLTSNIENDKNKIAQDETAELARKNQLIPLYDPLQDERAIRKGGIGLKKLK